MNRWIYYNAHWRIVANMNEPFGRGDRGGLSKNSWTDRDAVWGHTHVGYIRWGCTL